MKWKDIKSAPKDGTYVLTWEPVKDHPRGGYQTVSCWDAALLTDEMRWAGKKPGAWTDGTGTIGRLDGDYYELHPTHWMPLPAPPSKDKE